MTTTTVDTSARPAQLAPVRIGRGSVVHLGYLTTVTGPDGTRTYAAMCGAGNRHPDEHTPLRVATGPAVNEVITCRGGCATQTRAIDVWRVNARVSGQVAIADTGAPAEATYPGRWHTLVNDPRMTTTSVGNLALNAARWCASKTTGGQRTHEWYRIAVRHVVAGMERDAHTEHARRGHVFRVDGWVLTSDGAGRVTRIDTNPFTREVLRVYVPGEHTNGLTVGYPPEKVAPCAAPQDDAQVQAGTRPDVGTLVTVDGHDGWLFEVTARSVAEQVRAPERARVRQVGHRGHASAALTDVRPVVGQPAVCDRDGYGLRCGQPVKVDADGVARHLAAQLNESHPANVRVQEPAEPLTGPLLVTADGMLRAGYTLATGTPWYPRLGEAYRLDKGNRPALAVPGGYAAARYWLAAPVVIVGADAIEGVLAARLPEREGVWVIAEQGAGVDHGAADAMGVDGVVRVPREAAWLGSEVARVFDLAERVVGYVDPDGYRVCLNCASECTRPLRPMRSASAGTACEGCFGPIGAPVG